MKHHNSVAEANGCTDQQAIAALFACLTSWVVEEFDTLPRKYIEKVPGKSAPIFENPLEILKPKMQQYTNPRANLSEFQPVRRNKKESLQENFRCVRYLGDLALSEKTLEEKNKDLRYQFLEGLWGHVRSLPVATLALDSLLSTNPYNTSYDEQEFKYKYSYGSRENRGCGR